MRKLLLLFALTLISGPGVFAGSISVFTGFASSFDDWKAAVVAAGGGIVTETFDGGTLHQPSLSIEQNVTAHGGFANDQWEDSLSGIAFTAFHFHYDIFAWGGFFNLGNTGPGLKVTLSGSHGPYETLPTIANTTGPGAGLDGFWGIVSTTQKFDSVTLEAAGEGTQAFTLDNMVFNPEPSTYTMLGFGLLALVYVARSRQR